MKHFLGIAVISILNLLTANAANYATNFFEFTANNTLSGQAGTTGVKWNTNNSAVGEDDSPGATADDIPLAAGPDGIVGTADDLGQSDWTGVLGGWSITTSDYWAEIGGNFSPSVGPVVTTTYVFRPTDSTNAAFADFNVRFGVLASLSPRDGQPNNIPLWDTFGWTFRNAARQQLLRISFVPIIPPGFPGTKPSQLAVRVYNAANAELSGSGIQKIFYNSRYDLHVSVDSANSVSVSIGDSLGAIPVRIINSQPLANRNFSGPMAGMVHDLSATWTLADTTPFTSSPAQLLPSRATGLYPNYGSNAMAFSSYGLYLSPNALPTNYAAWVTKNFVGAPAADSTPLGNPDGDEARNLQEYSFASDPLVPNSAPLKVSLASGSNPSRLQFLWNRHAGDLSYQVLGGASLSNVATWPVMSADIISQVPQGDNWLITLRPTGVTGTRYFFKLRVNQGP